jgi:DNA invertase Pin-like site-specific DNA recombinase
MSKTFLYARVSTTDQTLNHQKTQAEAAGFTLDEVIADHGVSGVSTRLIERPQGKRLFDLLRSGDVLVVRWVDRLGRNYQDVTDTIREFMGRGVIIRTVINGLTFDGVTRDPMQQAVRDALIAFMAGTGRGHRLPPLPRRKLHHRHRTRRRRRLSAQEVRRPFRHPARAARRSRSGQTGRAAGPITGTSRDDRCAPCRPRPPSLSSWSTS